MAELTNGREGAARLAVHVDVLHSDDQPIETVDALQRLLSDQQVGVRSPISIIRRNDKLTINIVPAEAKD